MKPIIPAEIALRKYSETSANRELPAHHRAETPECPSLTVLDQHLGRNIILTDKQLEHIALCAGFCQKNLAYLRKYGEQSIPQLVQATLESFRVLVKDSLTRLGHLSEEMRSFGKSVVDYGLVPVFAEAGLKADTKPRHTYPVLIEDVPVRVFKGDSVVTQGPWIKDGRLIMRLTFELPQELRQRRPIQLLFVGKNGEIFNALDLPSFEEQLVNVELPVALPDHTLQPTDPLPCALVVRLGEP